MVACATRLHSLPLLVRCSLAVLLVVGSKTCSANGHRCPPSTSTWRLLVSLFPKLCSVPPKRRLIAGSASLVPWLPSGPFRLKSYNGAPPVVMLCKELALGGK